MVVNEEFKRLLQTGQLNEALLLALEQAVEVEVTTWVGSSSDQEVIPSQRLRSRLNLIAGTLEHELGEEFLDNPAYSELQQFHLDQIQASREMIVENVETLQQLFTVLARMLPANADTVESKGLSPALEEEDNG